MTDPSGLRFDGKRVLVTGGSSGIGNGIARAFCDAGAEVAITGTRDAASYEADLSDFDFHRADVANDDDVRRVGKALGAIDVLVNNAGTVEYRRKEFEIETFRRVVDVNLSGLMHCATTFHPGLRERSGSIINIASMSAFFATFGNPAYSASKGGVVSLTRTLAVAWARQGVRVNGVAPGFVKTKITQVSSDNEEINQGIIEKTPLGRWGSTAEMAGPCLFLASPLASFITGQTLVVDGGLSLAI